jgi:RNA polymerase sigma-70 factor (ECF subfamily)
MELYLMADEARANLKLNAAANGGSREQALMWFAELHEPLRRYLLCAGASAADADDAVQESFLRLYQHLEKRGDCSNLRGWVFQVARNLLRDERKSARHKKTAPLDGTMERGGVFTDPARNPEHSALDEERGRRLRQAIQKLPEQQRECILLRSAGMRYREIAETMGVNISSVGTLVARAIARLNEDLV